MKLWIVFAIVSMVFAGFTSVIAKLGLTGISGDLGLAVRTVLVFVFVLGTTAFTVPPRQWLALTPTNWWWLGLSAVTTSLSWIFYYRALKEGEVSTDGADRQGQRGGRRRRWPPFCSRNRSLGGPCRRAAVWC